MERLKKLQEDLDLSKKYPNYFNKWVFRCMIIILLLICFFAWKLGGFTNQYIYIECDSPTPCKNPIYVCQNIGDFMDGCIDEDNVPEIIKPYCLEGYCDKKTLMPNETIGTKPNTIIEHFKLIVFIVLVCAFALNHALYVVRFKRKLKEGKII